MRRPDSAAAAAFQHRSAAEVTVLPLDVTDQASRTHAVESVLALHGRIDVLVNNAGVLHVGSVEDTPDDMMRRVFETNYFGSVALSTAVAPLLRAQGSGRIINMSAIGAILRTPFLAAYCASKHALDAVSASMDIELPFGVRVCSILPGSFRTAIAGSEDDGVRDGADYAPYAAAFRRGFRERIQTAPDDFGPIVAVALEAATAPEPRPRYVGGSGAADSIRPVVDDLALLHQREMERAGQGAAPVR